MSDTPALLCPICGHNPPAKTLYGHPVCDVCRNRFAARRHGAFFIDYSFFMFLLYLASLVFTHIVHLPPILPKLLQQPGLNFIFGSSCAALIFSTFALKDGFHGYSPGKFLCGLQTLDSSTLQPISFLQSAKRNYFYFFLFIPFLGGIVWFIFALYIANEASNGTRPGDRFARTLVIWKKYAHLPLFGGNALVCETCSYNLAGNTSHTCPECGTLLSPRNKDLLALRPN